MRLKQVLLTAAVPLSIVTMFAGGARRIKAEAGAYPYFEGTYASGVCAVGQTSVELKSARITFNVPELTVEEYCSTAPTVTTAYTFYNPAERDEELSLAFPFELVRETERENGWNGKENCTFFCDGKPLGYELRYSYKAQKNYGNGDFLTDFDGADDFYIPDMPVTKYVYSIRVDDAVQSGATVKLKLKSGVRTKIVCEGDCTANTSLDCRYLKFPLKEGENTVSFYSVGGESEVVAALCATGGTCPAVRLTGVETMTFSEFVEAARPSDEISKEDWYRVSVSYFNSVEYKGILRPLADCAANDFVRWYVYSFNIPARSSVEHVVTAPLYPAGRDTFTHFSYRLYTEFETFPAVGVIKVEINTPLYLVEPFVEFTKTESGYEYECDDRFYDDFSFALSGSQRSNGFFPDKNDYTSLALALTILAIVVFAGLVCVTVLVVKNKREKQRYEEARQRYEMGLPSEGKIDGGKNAK